MNLFKKYGRNLVGRDFAVGDIHGHYPSLELLLAEVNFDKTIDRLFSVGDLVDRGPQSRKFAEYVHLPWFHAVRGNHDQMMLQRDKSEELHVQNGGAWFVWLPFDEKDELRASAGTLPVAIEVETSKGRIGLVHADVPFLDWSKFTNSLADWNKLIVNTAIWSRRRWELDEDDRVENIDFVVVGHSAHHDIRWSGNVVDIDTGSGYPHGKLTLLNLDTFETNSIYAERMV